MRQILAATDFSERSNRAVRRAGLLARDTGSALTIVHVVDDDRPARLVEAQNAAAQDLFRDALGDPALGGVRCEGKVLLGDPFDAIAKAATEGAADLIVMGAHRKQFLRDLFVGASVERVVRLRVAPVLMVNTDPTGPYRQGLAAVDLTEHSGYALRYAREFGLLREAPVVVVHAFDALAKGRLRSVGVAQDAIAKYIGEVEAETASRLGKFLDPHGGAGERLTMRVVEGPPGVVITQAAAAARADLVVLATHSRTGIPRMLLGSVTEELMRTLDRDILVVPPPAS